MTRTLAWCVVSFLVMFNIGGNLFDNAVAAPAARKTVVAVASSAAAKNISGKNGNTSLPVFVAAPPLSGKTSIIFPEEGIGKLYAVSKNWNLVAKRIDDKFVCAAKGKVSVQPDVPLSLKLNYLLTGRPELLKVPDSNVVQIFGDGIEFDDTICAPISKCISVLRVDLSSSDVTDTGIAQLCNMKQLKALTIAKTLIKGSCFQALVGAGLLYLDVSENNIDHSNYKYLALLDRIVKIRLNYDNLTDESLKSIGQMKSVRDLELRGNLKLTDAGMKYLFPLKNLQRLTIRDARFSVVGVETILKNMKIRDLTVDDKVLANADGKRLLKEYPRILNAYRNENDQDVNVLYAPLK